jgi:hypothetical protein
MKSLPYSSLNALLWPGICRKLILVHSIGEDHSKAIIEQLERSSKNTLPRFSSSEYVVPVIL